MPPLRLHQKLTEHQNSVEYSPISDGENWAQRGEKTCPSLLRKGGLETWIHCRNNPLLLQVKARYPWLRDGNDDNDNADIMATDIDEYNGRKGWTALEGSRNLCT